MRDRNRPGETGETNVRRLLDVRLLWLLIALLWGAASVRPAGAASLSYVSHPGSDTISIIDNQAGKRLGTIEVGAGIRPVDFALTPDGRHAYIVNGELGTVTILDTGSNRVAAHVPVSPYLLREIAIAPDGRLAYVAGYGGSRVSVVDTRTMRVVNTIPICSADGGLGITPDGRRLYASTDNASIEVVDPRTNESIVSIPAGRFHRFFPSPDGRWVYALGRDSGSIRVIDTETDRSRTIDLFRPRSVAFTPDSKLAWVTQVASVVVIDTASNRLRGTIPTAGGTGVVAVAPSGSFAYVATPLFCSEASCDTGLLYVIDVASTEVLATLDLPAAPGSLSFSSDGSFALVTYPDARAVSLIDTQNHRVAAPITVAGKPFAALFLPDSNRAYVATDRSITVVEAGAQKAEAVLLGGGPLALARSSGGNRLYVLNGVAAALSVVDTATSTVTDVIPVGDSAGDFVLAPDEAFAYVADYRNAAVLVIDLARREVVASVPTLDYPEGGSPRALSVSPDGRTLYVLTDYDSAGLTLIDTETKKVSRRIDLGYREFAAGLAVSPGGAFVLVTVFGSSEAESQVLVIDAERESLVAEVALDARPGAVVFLPSGERAYVATAGAVVVVDRRSATVVASVPVSGASDLAVTDGGEAVLAAHPASQSIKKIATATNTVVDTTPLGDVPSRITVVDVPQPPPSAPTAVPTAPPTSFAAGQLAYFATYDAGLHVVDPAERRVIARIDTGQGVTDVAVSPDGRMAYLPNRESGDVLAVDLATRTIRGTIPVGGEPRAVVLSPDARRAYVSNSGSDTVDVIDTGAGARVASVHVGSYPAGLGITPDGAAVFVANQGSNTVSVIDTAAEAVAQVVLVAPAPESIAVSPLGDRVYVAGGGRQTEWGFRYALDVIDVASRRRIATFDLASRPSDIDLSPDGRQAYMAASGCLSALVILPAQKGSGAVHIPTRSGASALVATRDGASVFVAEPLGLSVYDPALRAEAAFIPIEGFPVAVALAEAPRSSTGGGCAVGADASRTSAIPPAVVLCLAVFLRRRRRSGSAT
jgi:YVTN family beta-propeller protein